jgi:hypothetical protein
MVQHGAKRLYLERRMNHKRNEISYPMWQLQHYDQAITIATSSRFTYSLPNRDVIMSVYVNILKQAAHFRKHYLSHQAFLSLISYYHGNLPGTYKHHWNDSMQEPQILYRDRPERYFNPFWY